MPAFDPLKFGKIDHDVVYCSTDAIDLKMDIHYPGQGGPWPVLLFVHGGGWTEGDKAGVLITPTDAGYLVASINYRMYPDFRFPSMIEDVKCAIRFLRANASDHNIDPERIALVGHSAGAHLVALAALADESAGWDVGPFPDQTSRVQAAVVIAGPADLRRAFPDWVEELVQNVFGPEQLVSGSPVTYASPDDPPVFILHGDADPAVPVEQAYLLRDALNNSQVSVRLLVVQNAGHGLEPSGGEITPPIETIFREVILFLNENLK